MYGIPGNAGGDLGLGDEVIARAPNEKVRSESLLGVLKFCPAFPET